MDRAAEHALERTWGEHASLSMQRCIEQWENSRMSWEETSLIPEEAFKLGAHSVSMYTCDLMSSASPVYRHKICVVGPSTWGKTSLIKSLMLGRSSLEALETRTTGVDLFTHEFEIPTNDSVQRHEVTFWDFAGQDVYHAAHSVFFSRRTLFLVVLDLKAYASALPQMGERHSQAEPRIKAFVEEHVLYWLQLIFSRLPDAKVAFVGTKKDLVSDIEVDEIHADLCARVTSWADHLANELPIDRQRLRSVDGIRSMIAESMSVTMREWFVVSCTDSASVRVMQHALQSFIVNQQAGFLMPDTYTFVLQEVRRCRGPDTTAVIDRVRCAFVLHNKFVSQVCNAVFLCPSQVHFIMRTLHELGDVIWYSNFDCPYSALLHRAILSPQVVLDFIREAISHELLDVESERLQVAENDVQERRCRAYQEIRQRDDCHEWMQRLRKGGQIEHALLTLLPMWSELATADAQDDAAENKTGSRVLVIKSLLQDLSLAYPTGPRDGMSATASLVVPAYWKMHSSCDTIELERLELEIIARDLAKLPTDTPCQCEWEFEFGFPGLPTALFEHVVVRAFHPDLHPVQTTASCVVSVVPQESVLRIQVVRGARRNVLRVEAVASTLSLARDVVRFACMAVERELRAYPGLRARRWASESPGDDAVEVDEEDDSTSEAATWFRSRPWDAWNALDKFPRRSNERPGVGSMSFQREEAGEAPPISSQLCVGRCSLAAGLRYPVTCEWILRMDGQVTVETTRVRSYNDWAWLTLSLEPMDGVKASSAELTVSITQSSSLWPPFCRRKRALTSEAVKISRQEGTQVTLVLCDTANRAVGRVECELQWSSEASDRSAAVA
ncbi:hypothetical protein PINS_up009135 [Pythium insidiosum]|nr:hypothetical protein PINS_up009135 [Pythium insidiosum]